MARKPSLEKPLDLNKKAPSINYFNETLTQKLEGKRFCSSGTEVHLT